MKQLHGLLIAAIALLAAGCATSQEVLVGTTNPPKAITSVALVPQDGNSPAMDGFMQKEFMRRGVAWKAPVPPSSRTSPDIDAIVGYVDVWRWDLAMYLQSIDINMYDGRSGNLVVNGRWKDSPMHGFRDPETVIRELLDEMLQKIGNPLNARN